MMRRFVVFALCLCSLQVMGQGNDTTKIIVYDAFNPTQTLDTKRDIQYEKNQIKWNLGMIMRGCFEMDYERVLSEKFTFEVGAGVTYVDLIYAVAGDLDNLGGGNVKYKYGPLVTADMRFYPRSVTDFDGFYISLMYRYRKYNAIETVGYQTNNINYNYEMKNNHAHSEFGFIVGSQSGDYFDLVYDYYFGVGISNITKVYPDRGDYNTPPTESTIESSRPMLYVGLKMGLPF